MTHRLPLRIYYEDTDAGGVVYYGNYLRHLERGRTEYLRALGIEQRPLRAEHGIVFVIRSVTVDYLKPAVLDDELVVLTSVESLGRAQMVFAQSIQRGEETLLTARIRAATLDLARGKPAPLPKPIHEKLSAALS